MTDDELRRTDALRPPCPRCKGHEWYTDEFGAEQACHECKDGKVPMERLVATFNAVWDDAWYAELRGSERAMHARLRSVR